MATPIDWRDAIIYLGKRCKSILKSSRLEQKAEESTTAKKTGFGESYISPGFPDADYIGENK